MDVMERDDIPLRPTARLSYSMEDGFLILSVVEKGQSTAVVRYGGGSFSFLRRPEPKEWVPSHELRPSWRWLDNGQALCFMVLLCSDCFCGSQAFTDWKKTERLPYWGEILEDVRHQFALASVLLT